MRNGRPKAELVITPAERQQLEALARSRSLPAALILQAKLNLACESESNQRVARQLDVHPATVGKWRRRFVELRMAGLHDERRPGKPRSIENERLAELIRKTLRTKPATGTHWSVRDMALETGLSKSAVHRFFQLFGLKLHRQESFKLSTDPVFIEKVRDVVGLYLPPPDKVLVLCVDEKSQVQALERTQPLLPLGFGYAEGVTHDDVRHGTTTLFAALNVLDGSVIAQCKPRHRHQEFLAFLRRIEAAVPADLDIHLICDNYAPTSMPR
jgi:putative transposase